MFKRKIGIGLLIALLLTNYGVVFANSKVPTVISSVNRIEIKDHKINGLKADFQFLLDPSWENYIIVERENIKPTSVVQEKLNFYYEPQQSTRKPAFLMSLYVYQKSKWSESYGHTKVLESSKYVFAISRAVNNPFTSQVDKVIFNRFLAETKSILFIQGFIKVPEETRKSVKNTITVNNKMLKSKVLLKQSDVVYLPMKEACEALGYTVEWNGKDQSIDVYNGSLFTTVYMDNSKNKTGISVVMIDDRSYISSMFFIKYLKVNVEVDEYTNVFITNKK